MFQIMTFLWIQFFMFFRLFFHHMNLSRPENDIIRYREAYIYFFGWFEKFRKCSTFVIFHYRGHSCVLFWFFVSSRALLVQNASLLTPLYLGKNYDYRKPIVKHIWKLHFSIPKNVNVSLIENRQLTAASELST